MNLVFGLFLAALFAEAAGTPTCFFGNDAYPLCNSTTCNGYCYDGNGCSCTNHPNQTCLPVSSEDCDPIIDLNCCPEGLSWFPDPGCCAEELNCIPSCQVDEVCAYEGGEAVCQCNTTMYRHANRSDLVGRVECQASVMTVYFSKCMLERFHYDPYNSTLSNNTSNDNCTHIFKDKATNSTLLGFQALPISGNCGAIRTINGDKVTYSNVLSIPPDYRYPVIISSALNLSFSCTYNKTMQTSLLTALHPIIGTVQLPDVSGNGSATATMAAYKSNTFTDPIEGNTDVIVGEPLYIGIMTSFPDSTFVLRAEHCIASPTNSSNDAVELITDGCILNEDVNTGWISNGESLEVRFRVDTFAFKDRPTLFISCDVRLCNKTSGNCAACAAGRSKSDVSATANVNLGPIEMSASFDISSGSHTVVSWAVLGSSLLALLSLRMM